MKTIKIKSLPGASKVAVSNIKKWEENQLTPMQQLDRATESWLDNEIRFAKIECVAVALTAMAIYVLGRFVF